MGFLITLPVRLMIAIIQRLSLRTASRLGRGLGAIGWLVLRRHRRIAIDNLTFAFANEKSAAEIYRLARENFRRLGECYVTGVRTSAMSDTELDACVEFVGGENLPRPGGPFHNLVFATGHFGNFELPGRVHRHLPGWRLIATYRALNPPALNDLLQKIRNATGVLFFERTREARALRQVMDQGGAALGLLADQHGGIKGLWIPFFGRPCSTSSSIALLAIRYGAPIQMLLCFRVDVAKWRVEFGETIPTHGPDGTPRDLAAIMTEVNRSYEAAARRDPANWFWVHRRWKPPTERQLARARPRAPIDPADP